jgi:HlyD family secretion protein
MEQHRRKMVRNTAVIVALVAAGAILFGIFQPLVKDKAAVAAAASASKEVKAEVGSVTVGVTESGTVSIGTNNQKYDLTLTSSASTSSSTPQSSGTGTSSLALEVESVEALVGEVVKVGDPILKLTASSVENVRTTLETAVKTAQINLAEAKINRDKAKLAAQYDYKANKALGSTAKAEYDATVAQLNINVVAAERAIADANERIAEIPVDIGNVQTEIDSLNQYADSFQRAQLNDQITSLLDELATLQESLPTLNMKLEKAKRDRTANLSITKQTYDNSIVTYRNAEALYQIALNGIDDTVTSTTKALATSTSNLEDFNALVKDQSILAQYAGTLTTVGYAAGDTLSAATAIATIQNPADVTVNADVAQDDIAVVTVGNTVNIEFSAYPNEIFTATVSAISASVTNMRTSSVSYPVTATLTGDVSKIYDGMTGNVTFVTKEVKNVVHITNKAIINEGTKAYVNLKTADGSIQKTEVVTGFSNGYQVEIKSGLAAGDVVVLESQVTTP